MHFSHQKQKKRSFFASLPSKMRQEKKIIYRNMSFKQQKVKVLLTPKSVHMRQFCTKALYIKGSYCMDER